MTYLRLLLLFGVWRWTFAALAISLNPSLSPCFFLAGGGWSPMSTSPIARPWSLTMER